MISKDNDNITLRNKAASVSVNLFGGAITGFQLEGDPVNPLGFMFSEQPMPPNNRGGAPYRGHFLCLGRWGAPSVGERNAGMPDHGQIANIRWQRGPNDNGYAVNMHACGPLEGLRIERCIELDVGNPVFTVEEKVTNIQPLGRLYNMVQHPTIASPFLDRATWVACNGGRGFDQFSAANPEKDLLYWPEVKDGTGQRFDLSAPEISYNAVFSFIVREADEYGWIVTYSPRFELLLGYVWRRRDYPWIHLWQHWEGDRIKYRGLKFGTAGLHQPFKQILEKRMLVLGEKTVDYIDAGETVSRKYLSFLCRRKSMGKITSVELENGGEKIIIRSKDSVLNFNTKIKGLL